MKNVTLTILLLVASFFAHAQDIFTAARTNDTTLMKQLLETIPVDTVDKSGFTPLIIAVYNDSREATQVLLNHGADINAKDIRSGNTALMGAIFKGNIEMSKFLIAHGADVNVKNFNGASAIIFAATFGQLEIAKLLLEKGADKNVKDNRGMTAFDYAENQEESNMINLLR